MKVLVVDDNLPRCEEITNLLKSSVGIDEQDIHTCHNTQSAKNIMRNISFDFMILDVVLPKRSETPSAKFGLALLSDIKKRPNILKPNKIVGITAHTDDIASFKEEFENHCEIVIEASHKNKTWKSKIVDSIKFETVKNVSKHTSKSNVTCLSVHGIRTFGKWQQDLKKTVECHISSVNFDHYKYGYFTVLSFFIPFLRNLQVKKFKLALQEIIKRDDNDEIIVFCHSFGTYVVVNSIDSLIKSGVDCNKISKLILAGSVLRSNYDFSNILTNTNMKIINDCGYGDNILLLSEGFVPNTGMAGRVGFYGLNNQRFSNRYFPGGHSHYFDKSTNFIEKYWLPLFSKDSELDIVDDRNLISFKSRLVERAFHTIGKVKELTYIILAIWFLHYLIRNIFQIAP
ncbi:response regulator [Vibrio parahaemolyticus]|nr:response regulator [Vibrio parahaemolyticus]